MPFVDIIGHNLRTDRVRESVKTSSDSEESNQSDELQKKVQLHLKPLRKMQNFHFPEAIFGNCPTN